MSKILKKPELLAPAGDMERLQAAVKYGADAVYLGGTMFGMRAAPANFNKEQLKEAVEYCHERGVKVYLTCNVLPRNDELPELPEFLKDAEKAGVDALIISDIGVLAMAKKYVPDMEIHISTQSGIVNYETAKAFYDMGAKRVVTARELKMTEISEMRANIPDDMDIECFVHGAMCVSFSGRCLISNYLVGRDANRGECAQPCRWKYTLMEEKRPGQYFPVTEDDSGTYIMNSKDMCMIEHIPEMIKAGITSFKIEGRAKSFYYVASVTSAYRKAIDSYYANPENWLCPLDVMDELTKTSHRRYSTGFYFGPENAIQTTDTSSYVREYDLLGVVEKWEDGVLYCSQRGKFNLGDEIEVLQPTGDTLKFTPNWIKNAEGENVESTPHSKMEFTVDCPVEIRPMSIMRKKAE